MGHGSGIAKIIVGVDGSEASIEALKQAKSLSGPLGAEIEAMGCWDYPRMYDRYLMMDIGGFKESAEKVLDEAVTRAVGPESFDSVRITLVQGDPRSALIEASKNADMLIVGRRGMGGLKGLLVGSVSSAAIAQSECPVLVVRAPEEDKKS
ncbi:universal stress protein [Paeniglutamicibacter antarcticus]|uniref:UspA domain-containing protein n=1 Tax=Paeniglutamicibacter antarcticus TaxID=494023 RepID=A0ABP9TTU5_9MICC